MTTAVGHHANANRPARRSVAVEQQVLGWARRNNLAIGFSRVSADVYDAYLAAHPHLRYGHGIIGSSAQPVRVVRPQPEVSTPQPWLSGNVGLSVQALKDSTADAEVEQPTPVQEPEPAPAAKPRRKVSHGDGHGRIYPVGIREWAREQGYKVGNGAIKAEVVEAFYVAHPDQRPSSTGQDEIAPEEEID